MKINDLIKGNDMTTVNIEMEGLVDFKLDSKDFPETVMLLQNHLEVYKDTHGRKAPYAEDFNKLVGDIKAAWDKKEGYILVNAKEAEDVRHILVNGL